VPVHRVKPSAGPPQHGLVVSPSPARAASREVAASFPCFWLSPASQACL